MDAFPIPAESFILGFIGAGKMAESIAKGVAKSGVLPPDRICTAVHSNLKRRDAFESIGVKVLSDNNAVRAITQRSFTQFNLFLISQLLG